MAKSFGKTLRKLRQSQRIGLRMAAEELGLSPAYLSRIEQDKEAPPRPQLIRKMATLLGGGDALFTLAKTTDPDLTAFLRGNPSARNFVRVAIGAGLTDRDFEKLASEIQSQHQTRDGNEGGYPIHKEVSMQPQAAWSNVWQKFRQNLMNERRCPRHPEYPHVRSMVQGVINDIISVEDHGIRVRSHRTNYIDDIPEHRFRVWWEHLCSHGSASLVPGGKNNPEPWRSRIVGAIMAAALPDEIDAESSNSIALKG